jgi:hypothetical protein
MRILIALIISTQLFAANKYVRQGASGDGSDWTNAHGSLPATLTRGDTYYIADGTYSGYTFDDAASGTLRITIKKATAADHGTETGWSSTYGDGQSVFTGNLYFYGSYYTMDGNTTPAAFGAGPYGFLINVGTIFVGNYSQPRFTSLVFRAMDVNVAGISIGRGFRVIRIDDILISYCRMRNVDEDPFMVDSVTSITLEHSHLGPRQDTGSGAHGDAGELRATNNGVIRYNTVDWNGQHWFFSIPAHGRWDVYGNIQYGGPVSGKCMNSHASVTALELYYYNNTCYNVNAGVNLAGVETGDAKNNLFYQINSFGGWGSLTHSYNWYSTSIPSQGEATEQHGGNPFVNAAGLNFSLAGPTDAGATLSSTYETDRTGTTRGTDGVWDRGALEFGGSPPTCRITSTNLPDGTIGVAYSQTLTQADCEASTWQLTGSLPTGLGLNGSTGAITGTPTTAGVYEFSIEYDTDSQAYTVSIVASGCFESFVPWQSQEFTAQTGTFEMQFDATPNGSAIDSVIGASNGSGGSFNELAAIIRFANTGVIEARSGGVYQADNVIPYSPGTVYSFRWELDIPNHTANYYVTPSGGSEATIGVAYPFRTEQQGVSQLTHLSVSTASDSLTLCAPTVDATGCSITKTSLPDGRVGAEYTQTLTQDGCSPDTWVVLSGSLCSGLSIVGDQITGTPISPGMCSFVLEYDTDTQDYQFTIEPPRVKGRGSGKFASSSGKLQ